MAWPHGKANPVRELESLVCITGHIRYFVLAFTEV